MTKRSERGEMKGAQRHAEGNHGPATRSRIREEAQTPAPGRGEPGPQQEPRDEHPPDGTHRLFERREQHDPADEQSDKNRLVKDIERHDHERSNFAVPGGAASHPAMPPEHIDPEHPDARD